MTLTGSPLRERLEACPASEPGARDRFLEFPDRHPSGVRDIVARSWHRSRAAGVDAFSDRGQIETGRIDGHTLRAAAPLLQKLDDLVEDIGGFVTVTAPNGALVYPGFLRRNEEFPEGYSLLEESCGSTAEGVVLEEGRGVWLAPEEHYRDDMRGNWCFASLVHDPFHKRVRAIVGITFADAKVGRIDPASTLLMLEGAASRIEQEIASRTSARERLLLDEYLSTTRRLRNSPIVAMDGKNSLMNAAALSKLVDADLDVIAGYAGSVMSSGRSCTTEVRLRGLGKAKLVVTAVPLPGGGSGAIAAIRPKRGPVKTPAAQPPERPLSGSRGMTVERLRGRLAGVSAEFERTLGLAASAVEHGRSAVILGEAGAGKLRLADAMASLRGGGIRVDARALAGEERPLAELLDAARPAGAKTLIVGHADELSPGDSSEIIRHLDAHPDLQVLLTAGRMNDSVLRLAERSNALEIAVAPLRGRREDIPELAVAIAEEIGDRPLSRRLLTALAGSDWPRNVEQLRVVVSNAAERARGAEVTVDDLPQGFQRVAAAGRLSRLEEAEYGELRAALAEAGGNRRRVAEILQIGRSTLYRRMDFFRAKGLDV